MSKGITLDGDASDKLLELLAREMVSQGKLDDQIPQIAVSMMVGLPEGGILMGDRDPRTFEALVRKEGFRYHYVGTRMYVNREDVMAWVNSTDSDAA